MKRVRVLLGSISFVLSLAVTSLSGASAYAATDPIEVPLQVPGVSVQCPAFEGEFVSLNTDTCDLSVDKQVSVNGGAFVEADTSGDAASAFVGDTVTWKITVTNNSGDLTPHGVVYVHDVLPAGFSFGSYTASDGVYNYNDGSFFENDWVLPLLKMADDSMVTTLPATLTITTTATGTGLAQNTAAFVKYDPGSCDGGCVYADADSDNNSNDAWVNVRVKPQVLDASTTATLANTGSGVGPSVAAGVLLTTTLVVATYGRLYRRPKHYKI